MNRRFYIPYFNEIDYVRRFKEIESWLIRNNVPYVWEVHTFSISGEEELFTAFKLACEVGEIK